MIGSYVLLGDGLAQHTYVLMPWKLGKSRGHDYNTIKIGHVAIPSDMTDDVIIIEDITHHKEILVLTPRSSLCSTQHTHTGSDPIPVYYTTQTHTGSDPMPI
ncbi:hypothetical protein N7454_001002 [Penicillium verhagenii]|nr:hypothetical protein N7454_001002 [Penicillium verhagenii]